MTTENTAPVMPQEITDCAPQQPKTKSIIYETAADASARRLRFDRNVLPLPADAAVYVQVEADGSGEIMLRVPANKLQVIPAGKRLATRRAKRQETPATEQNGDE